MTTIAYKNGILAADKQSNFGPFPTRTTKVRRHGKWLAAATGDTARIGEIHEWIEQGMDPAKLPDFQRDAGTSATVLMVNEAGEVYLLENSHVLIRIEQDFYAVGSGRDFAMMAMHLGKSAPEAVELASVYDSATGQGVDTLTIAQPLQNWQNRQKDLTLHRPEVVAAQLRDWRPSLLQRQHQQRPGEPLIEPGNLVPGRA